MINLLHYTYYYTTILCSTAFADDTITPSDLFLIGQSLQNQQLFNHIIFRPANSNEVRINLLDQNVTQDVMQQLCDVNNQLKRVKVRDVRSSTNYVTCK